MDKVWKEVGVCLAFIAVSAVVYKDSLKLPPGNYDPLGGGTLPRMVCGIIIVLSLAAIAQAVIPALFRKAAPPAEPKPEYRLRPDLAVMLFILLVLYTLSIRLAVPFMLSTIMFLFLSTMVLAQFRVRLIPQALIISVVGGVAMAYTFTAILKVDLP